MVAGSASAKGEKTTARLTGRDHVVLQIESDAGGVCLSRDLHCTRRGRAQCRERGHLRDHRPHREHSALDRER